MILCRWCGVRPAREAELKWGHKRCSPCRNARHKAARVKWDRKYRSSPKGMAVDRENQRKRRTRMVTIGEREIVFPTVETKEQASALIKRRRTEWRSRATHDPSKS